MAKEGAITEQNIIGHFQKSVSASVLVSLVDWESETYLDIREVVPSDKPGESFTFTRKGIRLKAALLPQLMELLQKV